MNYIQLNDRSNFSDEEWEVANTIGFAKVTPFYKKHLMQGKLKIKKGDFIMGDIQVMLSAMKQLGIVYSYNDYPECLKPYLRREIWESTMGEVRKRLFDDLENEVELGLNWFIKPKYRLKRFTGFVLETIDDLSKCAGVGNQTKLWCSEPVVFVSEYRCPVINGKVMGMYAAPGKDGTLPDIRVVEQMAKDFIGAPSAYALDVGVLSSGETALIEVNDGFSLGRYGIPADVYTQLLQTRWEELCS